MDFLDRRLKQKLPSLTGSQRRLLDYIVSHDEETIFHTVRDLAQKSHVSEATVVRLSKALGFSGFPEFQRELRLRFKDRLKTTSRLQKTVKKVAHEGDLLAKILQADMTNIQETLQQIPIEEFRESVKAMDSAQRIVIIGLRGAYALAFFLGMALEFLQKKVWVVQPGIGDMWDRLLGLEKGDLVVGISFPRYTALTVEVLRFAKEGGHRTLAITDSLASPLAQYADHVLTARYQMDSFIESFTAGFSLINALVTALGVSNKAETLKALRRLETIWERQGVYFPTSKAGKEVNR